MNLIKNTSFTLFIVIIANILSISSIHSSERKLLSVPEDRSSRYDTCPSGTRTFRQKMRTPSPKPRSILKKQINTPRIAYIQHLNVENNNVLVSGYHPTANNTSFSIENLPICVRYSTLRQNCIGEFYPSENIVALAYRDGFQSCCAEKQQDQTSIITFISRGSVEGSLEVKAKDSDHLYVSTKIDNKIIISQNDPANIVATFTFEDRKK